MTSDICANCGKAKDEHHAVESVAGANIWVWICPTRVFVAKETK